MAQSYLNHQYSLYFQRATMLYQRPEIKASLEIILSVFTVTLLIFFAIRPTITNIFSLQKKIEDQETLLTKTDNKIGQLINAQKQLSENIANVPILNEAVPSIFNYFDISKRMDIIARNNNVSLEKVSFPGAIIAGNAGIASIPKENIKNYVLPNDKGLTTQTISFSVRGAQTGVFGFLTELENLDKVALIENVSVEKTQKSVNEPQRLLSVTGKVNFYAFSPIK